MSDSFVQFIRKRDYRLVRELGQGACGRTVLLHDEVIDEDFVCKKYSPIADELKEALFKNFIQEIKLLHLLYHRNVVRVFNYFIYPDRLTGYIVMEYIRGTSVDDYLRDHPEDVNEVFLQTIDGFRYLEENRILHRDIRPMNLMVRDDGLVKIIDFGFGKQVLYEKDFDKSITLNWWCELPREFSEHKYDFATEVYFVGKLFEQMIIDFQIEHFSYPSLLSQMCQQNPQNRITSFAAVLRGIDTDKFTEINFDSDELEKYRDFSSHLHSSLVKIESGARYIDDIEKVQAQLTEAYKRCMLEESVPKATVLINSFLSGPYYFNKKSVFPVWALKGFLDLLRSCSREKKNIVLANLQTKLDSVPRYEDTKVEDDIPF